ncbi:MAG: hypothetical protein IPO78_14860 [Saprospiraceae bacterium]|nr:hypothetical protein [Saprospiraceae bacterium]
MTQETRTATKVFPKAYLNVFEWTFIKGSTSVFRLNFCAKNPPLQQYRHISGQAKTTVISTHNLWQ